MKATLIKLLIRAVSRLPLSTQHALGRLIGKIVWRTVPRERNNALVNLEICFPDKDQKWRKDLARRSMQNTGISMVETAAIWQWDEERLCQLVKRVENESLLEDALAKNRGVLLASPHMGSWELINIYIGAKYRMTTLFRPSRLKELDSYIKASRERFGQQSFPITAAGMRSVLQALANKHIVGILPDQEPHRENGVFAPFFNTPACTMTLMGRLASRNKTPILFCVMQREKDGYVLKFLEPEPGCYNPDPLISATASNKTVERCIHLAPDQYIWCYRRFRLIEDGTRRKYRRKN